MTLGEKIKDARRKCGFSQEQLAEKLSVSRSAIAKWETDKGLPDVGNLKILARLLNVSVDYLLDETKTAEPVFRESYNPASYGYGCSKVKKDRVVRDKFPGATIYPLLGQLVPEKMEIPTDNTIHCRANLPDRVRHTDKAFYLIEKDQRQFFVTVTDAFVEIRFLETPLQGNRFSLDGWDFIKYNYAIKA